MEIRPASRMMKLVGKCQQRLPLPLLLPHFTQPDKLTGNPGISSAAAAATVCNFPTIEQQQEAGRELEVACFLRFLRARDACIVRGFLMTCTGGCPTCTCTDDDSFSRLASAAFTAGSLPMRWKFPVGRNLQRNSSVSNCWRQLILRF